MRARSLLALLLAGGLVAACGVVPPQVPDRSTCVGWFRQYDDVLQFNPQQTYDARRDRYRYDPWLLRLQVLLIQNDCQTRSRDLGPLEAIAAERGAQGLRGGGAPLGRAVAVHAGALTSDADAARAVAFFEAFGMRATSIGDPLLGRRVYVGPVDTQGALDSIIALAREAGFVEPYASRYFRF